MRLLPDEPNQQLYLKADLLDRQIVDIDGARVVRVNDLLLSESTSGLSVVSADVGFRAVLRGLGVEGVADKMAAALGYELGSKLIAWNFVAPLDEAPREVQLTVPSRLLKELHPSELADILDQLDPKMRSKTLQMMTVAGLAETLPESEPDVSREAFEFLTNERARMVVELMPPDEAADLLGSLGYAKSQQLLSLMGVKQASLLRELLGYSPQSAGGRMTPSFLKVEGSLTAAEAIDQIRRSSEAELFYYIYVVEAGDRLAGVVSLRDLLRGSEDRTVAELMRTQVVSVNIADDQELVASVMARYDLLAVPVVDEVGSIKGIVTVDDIVDVIEQETSENLEEVTGVYLGQGPSARSGRLAGFGISLAGGALAAALLQFNHLHLLEIVSVAWLLPVYLRVSQDLGTWSLARAFASEGLKLKMRLESLTQELLASLATASVSGLVVAIFVASVARDAGVGWRLGVGIFVGSLIASAVGFALPGAARSLGLHQMWGRGRVFVVLIGLSSLLIYLWALSALGGKLS